MAKCRICETELEYDEIIDDYEYCPYGCSQDPMDKQEVIAWATAMYFCRQNAKLSVGTFSDDWVFLRVVETAGVAIPDADCDLIMKHYKKKFAKKK